MAPFSGQRDPSLLLEWHYWLPLVGHRCPIWRKCPTLRSLRRPTCGLFSWLCRYPHCSLTWWNLVPAWAVCWPALSSYLKAHGCGDAPHTQGWGGEGGSHQLQSSHLGHQWQTDASSLLCHRVEMQASPPLWLLSVLFHSSSPFSCWDKHSDSPGHLPYPPSILQRCLHRLAGTCSPEEEHSLRVPLISSWEAEAPSFWLASFPHARSQRCTPDAAILHGCKSPQSSPPSSFTDWN